MSAAVQRAASEEKNKTKQQEVDGGVGGGATPRPQYRLPPLGRLSVSLLPLWKRWRGSPEAETPPASWPDGQEGQEQDVTSRRCAARQRYNN